MPKESHKLAMPRHYLLAILAIDIQARQLRICYKDHQYFLIRYNKINPGKGKGMMSEAKATVRALSIRLQADRSAAPDGGHPITGEVRSGAVLCAR